MTFRLLVCALLAALTMSLVTSVAYSKTEAECLEAIEVGNELIKENPNSYRGYASRGGAYGYLRKYDLAEKDLLKAISLNPDYPGLYVHLAGLYANTKRYEQSVVASRKVIALGLRSEKAYNALLGHLYMAKQFGECIKMCDEVLRIFHSDAEAFFFRALSKNELSSFSEAEVMLDLDKAYRIKPEDVCIKRAYELAKAGKTQLLKER
ncbi:MAG: hypothetical protein IPP97_23505 [Candidatus Obscuribacter sp.]|nr:hypothetical protein [Candidatus Obscuribacter sp.]